MTSISDEYETCSFCDGTGDPNDKIGKCWMCRDGQRKKLDPVTQEEGSAYAESDFIICHRCEVEMPREDIIPNTECCFGCHELLVMQTTGHGVVTVEGPGLLSLNGCVYKIDGKVLS